MTSPPPLVPSTVSTVPPITTVITGPTSPGTVPPSTGTTPPPGTSPTKPSTAVPVSTTPTGVIYVRPLAHRQSLLCQTTWYSISHPFIKQLTAVVNMTFSEIRKKKHVECWAHAYKSQCSTIMHISCSKDDRLIPQYRTSDVAENLGNYLSWRRIDCNGKMETTHLKKDHLEVNFRRSVIIAELWRPKVARPGNFVINFFGFFWKNDPSARIVPKICQGQPHISLTLFQISSISVHFQRSYCRTREDRFFPIEYFQYRLFEPITTVNSNLRTKPHNINLIPKPVIWMSETF